MMKLGMTRWKHSRKVKPSRVSGGNTGLCDFCSLVGVADMWTTSSQMLREPMAEFAGVMILIIFGVGVDLQVVLSTNTGVASGQQGVSIFFRPQIQRI